MGWQFLAAGGLSQLAGQARLRIGHLNVIEPAVHSTTFNGSTLSWESSGSYPAVGRATTEVATNGIDWTMLGPCARVSNAWQRTGLVLPPVGTFRLRGPVVGGHGNPNGWFVDAYYGRILFASQPASRANNAGTTATFSVEALAGQPASYRWWKDGAPLADAVEPPAVQSDGKILLSGRFFNVNGRPRRALARLHSERTLDESVDHKPVSVWPAWPNSIVIQADGKILIAGGFTNIPGQTRMSIARLNPDGTLDPTFNTVAVRSRPLRCPSSLTRRFWWEAGLPIWPGRRRATSPV